MMDTLMQLEAQANDIKQRLDEVAALKVLAQKVIKVADDILEYEGSQNKENQPQKDSSTKSQEQQAPKAMPPMLSFGSKKRGPIVYGANSFVAPKDIPDSQWK